MAAARTEIGRTLPDEPERPEDAAEALQQSLDQLAGQRCSAWFDRVAHEMDTALSEAAGHVLSGLVDDVVRARRTAAHPLDVPLDGVTGLELGALPRPPRWNLDREIVWRELVTNALANRLPPALRRKRLHRQLRDWAEHTVPRPFGRARSTLQSWLENTTRHVEDALNATWNEHLASLEGALTKVAQQEQTHDPAGDHGSLSQDFDELDNTLRTLDDRIHGHSHFPAL